MCAEVCSGCKVNTSSAAYLQGQVKQKHTVTFSAKKDPVPFLPELDVRAGGAVGGSVQGVVPFTGFPWRVFAGLAGLLVFLASASRVKQQHRGLLLDAPVSTSRN